MQNGPGASRTWIWFFLTVGVLGAVVVTVLIRYNLGQQLQPEELAKAREMWSAKGPSSYRLIYTVKRGEAEPDTIVVHVRKGRTDFVSLNGQKLEDSKFAFYGMDATLDNIEQFLENDRQEGKPRTFLRAVFDPVDGRLRSFVRRVMGSRERVEINVRELEPLDGSTKKEK